MAHPKIWNDESLAAYLGRGNMTSVKVADGSTQWVCARPMGYPSLLTRFKAAYLVFTGRADAVKWRHQ